MSELVALETAGHVATITLNRPESLNAYTIALKDELIAAIDVVERDDDVRGVVVTGAGRAFCAGMDLSNPDAFSRLGEDEAARRRDSGGELALRLFEAHKPYIAAVNGAAVGVGVTMILPMDVRLASERAQFRFPFAQLGIVMESASSWFLPRLVGPGRAAEWTLTGRLIGPDEARDAGLIHSVHSPDGLLQAAHELAGRIAGEAAPVSVALNRQLMWRSLTFTHPLQAHRAESRAMYVRGTSHDVREGMASFAEHRPAVFGQTVPADLPDIFNGL